MTYSEIATMTIDELAPEIEAREISSVEVIEAALGLAADEPADKEYTQR